MKRNIDSELLKWKKKSRRKPLILRGARQVGKTYSVKRFSASFDSLACVDLEKTPELHKVFSGDLSPSRLIADLEVMLRTKIIPGKTLLFIDEIQSCPRAITALRYFYEEVPELHVIAAGSLLEFALKDISFPVGRIQFLHLRPLCFAEYLSAIGNEIAAEYVRARPRLLSPIIHSTLSDELRRYFFIGGMPESVKAYIDTGSLQESFEVQAEIIETYRLDFGK
ncbi:AAA family ATPase, partial [Candidatus Pacearchaeota archaeon]|nr:AAA family ATPase [Candidatus Pacearchaeota archaeon]